MDAHPNHDRWDTVVGSYGARECQALRSIQRSANQRTRLITSVLPRHFVHFMEVGLSETSLDTIKAA